MKNQIIVGTITAIVTLLTLPLFGLLGVLAFRCLVKEFTAIDLAKKPQLNLQNGVDKVEQQKENHLVQVQQVKDKKIKGKPDWDKILVTGGVGYNQQEFKSMVCKLNKTAFDRIYVLGCHEGVSDLLWQPTDGQFQGEPFSKDEKSLLIFLPNDEGSKQRFSDNSYIKSLAAAQMELKEFLELGNTYYIKKDKTIYTKKVFSSEIELVLPAKLKKLIQYGKGGDKNPFV